MKEPKYIPHIRKDKDGNIDAIQSNEEHSLGVAELARKFACEFSMGDFGYIMGLKEKEEFQEYIQDVNRPSGSFCMG